MTKVKINVNLPYLKNLALKKGINIGACVGAKYLNNKTYRELIKREFNILTPENEMKFWTIHPIRNRYNLALADKIVSFAKRNKMKIRGHTLVWHRSLPEWVIKGKFTRGELTKILQNHINKVVRHYKGKLIAWDVVNEAVDDNCRLRKGVWLDIISF